MSTKTIEIKVSEEVYALVKKMAEAGRGRGRGAKEPCTIGEMAGDLVKTGALRRTAANKWARAHAAPKKPKAPKAPKAKAPKAPKAKAPKAPKAKSAKKSISPAKPKKAKAPKVAAPASTSAAAPAAANLLE
jgi:hypothetical protein